MPIVFAIQNSRYAVPLDLSFQNVLYKGSGESDNPLIASRILSLKYADFSSSDPYFALDSVTYMNTTEGSWTFQWTSWSETAPIRRSMALTIRMRLAMAFGKLM
jgi:hypothetical protein